MDAPNSFFFNNSRNGLAIPLIYAISTTRPGSKLLKLHTMQITT